MLRVMLIGGNHESFVATRRILSHPEAVAVAQVLPAGPLRERTSDFSPELVALCRGQNIATLETDDINSNQSIEWLESFAPDLTITLGWSQLYRSRLLSAPLGLNVGSHPSALPYGRGRAPIPWTILEGLSRSAVTLFEMTLGVDAGPILRQEWFDISRTAHAREVYDSAATALGDACWGLISDMVAGTLTRLPQDEEMATYRLGRRPEDGSLDFSRPVKELMTLIRAAGPPYPGAFCMSPRGGRIVVERTSEATSLDLRYKGVAGQVLRIDDGRVVAQATDGPLVLEGLRMPADEPPLRAGDRLRRNACEQGCA